MFRIFKHNLSKVTTLCLNCFSTKVPFFLCKKQLPCCLVSSGNPPEQVYIWFPFVAVTLRQGVMLRKKKVKPLPRSTALSSWRLLLRRPQMSKRFLNLTRILVLLDSEQQHFWMSLNCKFHFNTQLNKFTLCCWV